MIKISKKFLYLEIYTIISQDIKKHIGDEERSEIRTIIIYNNNTYNNNTYINNTYINNTYKRIEQ